VPLQGAAVVRAPTLLQINWFCTRLSSFFNSPVFSATSLHALLFLVGSRDGRRRVYSFLIQTTTSRFVRILRFCQTDNLNVSDHDEQSFRTSWTDSGRVRNVTEFPLFGNGGKTTSHKRLKIEFSNIFCVFLHFFQKLRLVCSL